MGLGSIKYASVELLDDTKSPYFETTPQNRTSQVFLQAPSAKESNPVKNRRVGTNRKRITM